MWSNQGGTGGGFGGGDGGYGGGGGFASPGGFSSPSQSQPKARMKSQTMIPCTTQQIHSSQQADDVFKIGEMDVHQVTIVGLVRSVKEQTTNITYELDDMSGPPLEVKHWLDNSGNAASDQTKPIVEYTYVRVHGNIRNFQGKKTVVAFRITELDDLNELTSHILEVCHNHLHHSVHKGKPGSMGEPAAVGQMNTGTGFQGNVDSGGYAGAMPQNGLSNVQQQIYKLICACPNAEGISIQDLQARVQGLPRDGLRDAIEFLSSEGHIYSTIDEDHYKSTDS